MKLEELSEEQLKIVNERCRAFCSENCSEWYKVADLASDTSIEVVGLGYAYEASWAAYGVTNSWAACWVTRELIGMHKILEDQQRPLTLFPMFLETL
jgi:hypothetical protein